MNRLHLDFSIDSAQERSNFVNEYLNQFNDSLTTKEQETIANYILWGKNSEGENFVQEKLGKIETKHSTWTREADESLESLMESPAFNEATVHELTMARPKLVRREKFNRESALRQCPDFLREQLTSLFRQIDELDLQISLYELAHNKRLKLNDELRARFTENEIAYHSELVKKWTQYHYLNQKHELVNKRTEQYVLGDAFISTLPPTQFVYENNVQPAQFGVELDVLPLGLAPSLPFKPLTQLNPSSYSEDELRLLSNLIWEQEKKKEHPSKLYFDFREFAPVYELLLQYYDFKDDCWNSDSSNLITTLDYYIEFANLSDCYADILDMKMRHVGNIDIALTINKKYGKTYSANYISTIFCKKIIAAINEAATRHEIIVNNLFYEENFKQCSCCKIWLLRDTDSFIRKARSSDGLNSRCKKCDKEARNKNKC